MDASDSTAGSGSAPDLPALTPLAVGETCMYMSPSPYTGCRMPRSCQSCLATAGCMIDEVGSCVSTQDEPLDAAKNFRLARAQGLVLPNATADGAALSAKQTWQFPAGRVKYCSMGDAVCSACTRRNFWRSRSSSPDSRYCVGADGSCVCIDVCERRWYVNQDCSARGSSASLYAPAPSPSPSPTGGRSPWSTTNSMGDPSMVNRIWQGMVGSIIFVMVVLAFVLWARRKSEVRARQEQEERRRRAQARRERRQTTADQLGVSALNLSGWDAYRRELIEKETAQLASGSETKSEAPAVVQEATSYRDNDNDDHNDDDHDDSHDGRSTAYVRMQEEPAAEAAAPVVSSQEESSDDRASAQRPSATLAPLSVSQTVQPRR